jgi:hypothetical protein
MTVIPLMKHGSGICFIREDRPFQNPLSCQLRHLGEELVFSFCPSPGTAGFAVITRVRYWSKIGSWPLALSPWLNTRGRLKPTLVAAIKVGFNRQVICQKLRLQGMAPTSFAADEVALST